jgi:hypothetical protein
MYTYIHMNIFFTCSYTGKVKYQKYYDLIVDSIKKTNVALQSPELDKNFPAPEATHHYQQIRDGILNSDAVIMDVSDEGFQLGFEAAQAIQSKKHVLVLSLIRDFSQRIDNRYFHAAKYSELNIDDIISEFVNSLRHHQFDQRFNFFLSQKQLQTLYLNANKLGLTKSDYLRSLLDSSEKIS